MGFKSKLDKNSKLKKENQMNDKILSPAEYGVLGVKNEIELLVGYLANIVNALEDVYIARRHNIASEAPPLSLQLSSMEALKTLHTNLEHHVSDLKSHIDALQIFYHEIERERTSS